METQLDATRVSQRNFADAIRDAFRGPYATSSFEYRLAATHAARPLIYDQTLIRFCIKRTSGPNPFLVGSPITVTYEPLYMVHRGRALYGLVREICDTIDTIHWSGTLSKMTVEVHCIPDFPIDWQHAVPWVLPPPGAVFIQPHGFTLDRYRPRSLYATPTREIIRLPLRLRPLPDEHDFIFNLWNVSERMRLPMPEDYVLPPSNNEDDTNSQTFLPPGIDHVRPHRFLDGEFHSQSPNASSLLCDVHSPPPSPSTNASRHDEVVEAESADEDEASAVDFEDEVQGRVVRDEVVEAIYQLEVDIADEVLNMDQTPSISPSSTPASLPSLLPLTNGQLSAHLEDVGTQPALVTAPLAFDVEPPRYTELTPPEHTAAPFVLMPYVPPPPLCYESLPAYGRNPQTAAIPSSLLGLTFADAIGGPSQAEALSVLQ